VDIHAGTTILAEGCRGSLAKQLDRALSPRPRCHAADLRPGLQGALAIARGTHHPGLIQHSVGWPLDSGTYGGSFIYHLDEDRLYIGYVVGLDYADPRFSPFEAFQQFKHHPDLLPLLEGGEIISSGARTIIEGGMQALPRMDMPVRC
jgi:electron-transferring-flavoprotein dehydrogenase